MLVENDGGNNVFLEANNFHKFSTGVCGWKSIRKITSYGGFQHLHSRYYYYLSLPLIFLDR